MALALIYYIPDDTRTTLYDIQDNKGQIENNLQHVLNLLHTRGGSWQRSNKLYANNKSWEKKNFNQ